MGQAALPDWESALIDEAIAAAEQRLDQERRQAKMRAVQLAREQAYHRLAVAIDLPVPPTKKHPGQLELFEHESTLFDA